MTWKAFSAALVLIALALRGCDQGEVTDIQEGTGFLSTATPSSSLPSSPSNPADPVDPVDPTDPEPSASTSEASGNTGGTGGTEGPTSAPSGTTGTSGDSASTASTASTSGPSGPTTSSTTTSTTTTTTTTTIQTQWPTSDALDAQFLIQASFGPSKSSMAELKADGGYEAWIMRQMTVEPSLLRAFYRQRANPSGSESRLSTTPRTPCEEGSRWSNVAFDLRDVGREVVATGAEVFVDGELRTLLVESKNVLAVTSCSNVGRHWWSTQVCDETQTRPWTCNGHSGWVEDATCQQACWDAGLAYDGTDCSVGWKNFIFSGYICYAAEAATVGDLVGMSSSKDCSSVVYMRTPKVWMDGLSDVEAKFTEVRPHIVVLSEVFSPCALTQLVQVNGTVYRHDPRFKLVDAQTTQQDICVGVPPSSSSHLEQCELRPSRLCEVAQAEAGEVNLTAETLELIHEISGRLVFEISNLRQSVGPCDTLSRWQRCDCAVSVASPELSAALQLKTGDLRDVFVRCSGVAAGSVVELSTGDRFQHVNIFEGNVYDFTDWASEHPGGREAIAKWSTNNYKLVYPNSHTMDRFDAYRSKLHYIGKGGQAIRYGSLPSSLRADRLALALQNASSPPYSLSCPSPGEAANKPSLGHGSHYHTIFGVDFAYKEVDIDFDFPSKERELRDVFLTRINMWMGQVMSAPDQLRQRMAWALSQILVVGTGGFTHGHQNELWMKYYDILVRQAFGNYLDLLKEVTFSPLMGEYLSFMRNSAFDHDQNYPDENYAREVMQLFTIGTVKLNPDGSRVLDAEGNPIPTYTNEDIMTFARVFTGLDRQLPRTNVEEVHSSTGRNMVDPMQMNAHWHDAYPKQILDKNYLGDGLPLCSELPRDAFLMQGARYEFISSYDGQVLSLQETSALYRALCGSVGACSFKPVVVLEENLACLGDECNATWPGVVQIEGIFYEYVLPPCMHFYFFEGRIATGGGDRRGWTSQRICTDPATPRGAAYCCAGCSSIEVPWFANHGMYCSREDIQSTFLDSCNKNEWWVNNRFCEQRCFQEGLDYGINCTLEGSYREEHVCGVYQELMPLASAEKRCQDIGMHICDRRTETLRCGLNDVGARVWTLESCAVNVTIDANGKVASHHTEKSRLNKVAVIWDDGAPDIGSCPEPCESLTDSCICPISVELEAVFKRMPMASELGLLKVGAWRPETPCSACGDVKGYGTLPVDETWIFEYQGHFFRNVRSVARVAGKSFRNPPVVGADEPTSRSATLEVEMLLEHLVRHDNAAPFLASRLIQRFVTSNPSRTYVAAVADAFRSGSYGRNYSGAYGDLGAAMAAVLLHPEARTTVAATTGALREPLLKLVHFLRALDFQDERHLLFEEMQENIGQEPFASPTVFNFYMPDYELSSGYWSPEFQIFDSASVVNFFNGIFSLIEHRGVTDCNFGFGIAKDRLESCAQMQSFSNKSFEELELLLTGGRLTEQSREAVMSADSADSADSAALQEAMVLTAEFHTLGALQPMGPRAPEAPAAVRGPPRSYKAVVNIFLEGGADSFNMLVPINCALHQEYLAVRGAAALSNAQLLEIQSSQSCGFALHHRLPKIRELYASGEAAFISNIGPLVEPLTKHEYNTGARPTCVGLFSHSDQVAAAQTLKCQVAGASPKGVAGRMADALASGSQKFATNSFSMQGKKTWSEGFTVGQKAVDSRGSIPTLQNYATRRGLIGNITREQHGNIYAEEYSKNLGKMVDGVEDMAAKLADVTLSTEWPPEPTEWSEGVLQRQFKMVSKLIASREAREAEREFYYVGLGGFDSHNDMHEELAALFAQIDRSVDLFVKELKAQGVFDSVVLVTTSDFGRTLTSNGKGTDHGWAGNHFMVGGQLRGGEIYNDFPASLAEDGPLDVGRGRLIPKYPWENIMIPIAEWMGVDAADREVVFPNLPRFNSSMILPTTTLFNV